MPTKRTTVARVLLSGVAICTTAQAQVTNSQAAGQSNQQGRQTQSARPAVPAASAPGTLTGSVPEGQASATPLDLTLQEAVRLALRRNLGVLQGEQNVRLSGAERLRALNALLPNLTTSSTGTSQQVNLRAFGFPGSTLR